MAGGWFNRLAVHGKFILLLTLVVLERALLVGMGGARFHLA
jgi:hypothetical protein